MLRAYGVQVDVIEVFVYHVLVQEPDTGKIYLVLLNDIEELDQTQTPEESESTNVFSMKGWKEWRKEKKPQLQKSKNKKLPRQKPLLKLVTNQ